MPFNHGEWYQGAITGVDYIKSEKKGTPALELTVEVSDRGPIVGQWWLTDSMVSAPGDKNRKVPRWEAARMRCKSFGCDDEGLVSADWVGHIRKKLVGQTAAVLAEINDYGDVKAAFIAKPKGGGGGFVKQEAAPSPFAGRSAASDPFDAPDDDLPF